MVSFQFRRLSFPYFVTADESASALNVLKSVAVDNKAVAKEMDNSKPEVVSRLATFCSRPIHVKGVLPNGVTMWINGDAQEIVGLSDDLLRLRVDSVLQMTGVFFEYLRRANFNEAASDMFICGPLLSVPLLDVFQCCNDRMCFLGIDQETKCVASNKRIPLLQRDGDDDVVLIYLRPDLFAYTMIDADTPILLFTFENKVNRSDDNGRITAAKTALLQFSYLSAVDVPNVVFPFMTMTSTTARLY